jgi:hypothetical protein
MSHNEHEYILDDPYRLPSFFAALNACWGMKDEPTGRNLRDGRDICATACGTISTDNRFFLAFDVTFSFATPKSSCRQGLMLSRWLEADARAE